MGFRLVKIQSIRVKLIVSLIAVSLFMGLISLLVGAKLLYQSVISDANRVRQDLNVARLIYEERIQAVRLALEVLASNHEY